MQHSEEKDVHEYDSWIKFGSIGHITTLKNHLNEDQHSSNCFRLGQFQELRKGHKLPLILVSWVSNEVVVIGTLDLS